jgi:hypothetical protein
MTLTIPYKYSQIQLESNQHGDLEIILADKPELITYLFNSIYYTMSHHDLIMSIGEDEFQDIITYYQTQFKE